MIKKNQFALIFLTIVTMLAVWYIKAPVSADKNNSNTTEVIESEDTGRLEELALMREAIRNEKEVLLELQVINCGYRDALVHATNNGVEVLVISDEDSASKANEIILMTLASFDTGYDTVVVNFMSADELKNE